MNMLRSWPSVVSAMILLGLVVHARADESFAPVADEVNKKVVKLYGAGGFNGLASYGTGILVSPQGHILTAAGPLLATENLRVHLYDGRRFEKVKVLAMDSDLDAALVKIEDVSDLPYFDMDKAAQAPLAQAGDWILAFSNQFQIATRDEPMSVQRGVIAALAKLQAHRGVFNAPYAGEVYIIDAITNNPGAAGGAITTRKGDLLGIIGKELRNSLTETWINYAIPAPVLARFVKEVKEGTYKPKERKDPIAGQGGYHGIVLIPRVVERTPPFVEQVLPNSPAARAGLKPDDLIVYVDGEQMISVDALRDVLGKSPPGTQLRLEVRRFTKQVGAGDKLITVELKLEEPPARTPISRP